MRKLTINIDIDVELADKIVTESLIDCYKIEKSRWNEDQQDKELLNALKVIIDYYATEEYRKILPKLFGE